MKKCNLLILFLAIYVAGNSQSFKNSIYSLDGDFNHTSIETILDDDSYVVGGTLFAPSDNDMFLMKLDRDGKLIWEKRFDFSIDDRILDITVGAKNTIVVTGHIYDRAIDSWVLYLGEFDFAGTLLNEKKIQVSKEEMNSSGTNIIYHHETDSYMIGGFIADGNFYDIQSLHKQKSFVLRISSDFTEIYWTNTFFENKDYYAQFHNSVNDIVSINKERIFVLGSVDYPTGSASSNQGVLALFLDTNTGQVLDNVSFNSSNLMHLGVSACYNGDTDELFVLSNNTEIHDPQINSIKDATTTPYIDQSQRFDIGATESDGFQIDFDADGSLVVLGGKYSGYQFWTAVFSQSLNPYYRLETKFIATGFENHGGPLFTAKYLQQSYIYHQEIMTRSTDGNDLVALGPLLKSGVNNYGIDLFSATKLVENCSKELPLQFTDIKYEILEVNSEKREPELLSIKTNFPNFNTNEFQLCCDFNPFTSFHNAVPDIFSNAESKELSTDGGNYPFFDIEYGDIDGDGITDILYTKMGVLHLVKGVNVGGTINYSSTPVNLNLVDSYSYRLFDWDSDGDNDIIALNEYAGTQGIYVYDNLGGGTIGATPMTLLTAPTDFPVINDPEFIEVGDLNEDGHPDLLLTHQKQIMYFENNGSSVMNLVGGQAFGSVAFITSPPSFSFPVPELYDVDCDGDLDLFVSDTRASNTLMPNGRVYFHENNGIPSSGTLPNVNTAGLSNQYGLTDQNTITLHADWIITRFVDICADNNNTIAIAYHPANRAFYYYRSAPISYCALSKAPTLNTDENTEFKQMDFQFFPNPVNETLNLDFTKLESRNPIRVVVYSISGQKVEEINIESNERIQSINVSQWEMGIYKCKIDIGEQTFYRTIIKD